MLSYNKIGIWHKINKKKLYKLRKIKLNQIEQNKCLNFFHKIGYPIKKINKQNKFYLFKNFQRRFRQELINGKLDKECLKIAENLANLAK